MKNYLTLEVGGKVRGLRFNMGTLDFIKELTGTDPLTFAPASQAYDDVKPYAKVLFHAALLSDCRSKKENVDFSKEDIEDWFNDLGLTEVLAIIKLANQKSNEPSANGEVSKDTQQATHLAAGN